MFDAVPKRFSWKRYEAAVRQILDEFAHHFGIHRVEGKQSIRGLRSGTEWEIEAKGIPGQSKGFFIIECRRGTRSTLDQEQLGGLAYRIIDSGALGGIMVTSIGDQKGPLKVAKAAKIITVKLNAGATPKKFPLDFLGDLILRPVVFRSACEIFRFPALPTVSAV
jgi:hypothetical protein